MCSGRGLFCIHELSGCSASRPLNKGDRLEVYFCGVGTAVLKWPGHAFAGMGHQNPNSSELVVMGCSGEIRDT